MTQITYMVDGVGITDTSYEDIDSVKLSLIDTLNRHLDNPNLSTASISLTATTDNGELTHKELVINTNGDDSLASSIEFKLSGEVEEISSIASFIMDNTTVSYMRDGEESRTTLFLGMVELENTIDLVVRSEDDELDD